MLRSRLRCEEHWYVSVQCCHRTLCSVTLRLDQNRLAVIQCGKYTLPNWVVQVELVYVFHRHRPRGGNRVYFATSRCLTKYR